MDLESECPFWAMQAMCGAAGGCSVCKCDEDEIPIPWKVTKNNPVNTFLGMDKPKKWVDDSSDVWFPKQDESRMTYVNLEYNPESNTGYSGKEANRVWQAIYTENCFKSGVLENMCLEERVFFRLLSGLHSSITMHVAAYFYKKDPANKHIKHLTYEMFAPNYNMFENGIARFPDRLKNLYFLYTFTLRAIQKLTPVLKKYEFVTGNAKEDEETKELIQRLLSIENPEQIENEKQCCLPSFDESNLFKSAELYSLKEQMKNHFRNISMIMDCVACEKCKMWAKLEMLGMATALKIVLSDSKEELTHIQRNELIALVNSFKQYSQSIEDIRKFNDMKWRRELSPYISYAAVAGIVLLVLRLFVFVLARESQKRKKE